MKKFQSFCRPWFTTFPFLLFCLLLHLSCKSEKQDKAEQIEIVTESMEFITRDTIPSGWNTFVYKNNSNETHFFLMDKYPEGKTIEDTKKDIFPPFDRGMDLINEGKTEEGIDAFSALPAWMADIVFMGGSGLVSPQKTAVTTIKLDPGYYIMECYVKMPNGKFHASMGMVKAVVVTEEDSGNTPPEPTVNLSISSTEGITYDKLIIKGKHIFAVNFKDQVKHEHFLGHDVNLVKLSDNADLEELARWMNWSSPDGLISPAPEGVTFLGGVNDMPAGHTGYFEADLDPGKYAFISEVPNPIEKNMLVVFEIIE